MGYYKKSLMLWDTANPRPLCLANTGVVDMEKWPRICSNSKYNKGQGHLGQVHSKKVAPIGLKMAELLQKRKIPHVLKISAQSEQLQQRYCRFYWFLKIACLRYVSTWGRDCVSGVLPCLVHSQNLSKLIGHSDDGQKPNRTAVRAPSHHTTPLILSRNRRRMRVRMLLALHKQLC